MEPVEAPKTPFMITGKLYDRLKFAALILLPALSTLYFTLGTIWGFPNKEEVIGTIAALDTFLGVILKVSNVAYDNSDAGVDGHISVLEKQDGSLTYSLELKDDPEALVGMKQVKFSVGSPTQWPPQG